MVGQFTFSFLSVKRRIACQQDWNHHEWPKLWLYNLHYFDDLSADQAASRVTWHKELISRWVSENPPVDGIGWDSYPTSLRIVNWVKWALAGNTLHSDWMDSLAIQARWLRRGVEWHLMGNHLFANAKALLFAGVFFTGMEAANWRKHGLAILRRETREQILPDGGHFERSPMYHAIILEDLLDLIQLAIRFPGVIDEELVAEWHRCSGRMLCWLNALTHSDGEIAFFNDATGGAAPNLEALKAYAAMLRIQVRYNESEPMIHMADSGYVRLKKGVALLIADVGLIGPDYLPGHAHADTLSFELSISGCRLLINSGVSEYDVSLERLRQRGTAAHNTVQIDGADSSEVWASFRVARRATPIDLEMHAAADSLYVTCAHDGYKRLPNHPIHRRQWRLTNTELEIIDTIERAFGSASASYHFHPAVRAIGNESEGCARLPNGKQVYWEVKGGLGNIKASLWHPQFGVSTPNQKLEIKFEGPCMRVRFSW